MGTDSDTGFLVGTDAVTEACTFLLKISDSFFGSFLIKPQKSTYILFNNFSIITILHLTIIT